MYHPDRIAAHETALLREMPGVRALYPQGIPLYSIDDSRAFTAQLMAAVDEQGQPTRALSEDEQRFIGATKLRVIFDYPYWAERFVWIDEEGHGLRPLYPLWESQKFVLDTLARLELQRWRTGHPDGLLVNVLKARQLGVCLAPETCVLTPDLRWISLDAVTVGQELVAVDEDVPGGSGAGRKMRTAVVEGKREVNEPAFRLVLGNGETVVATGPHRFLTRKRGGVDTKWCRVDRMIVGEQLRYITQPWGEGIGEDHWFGGLLDGEGSLRPKDRAGVELCVSQVAGPVYERALAYVRDRGIAFREEIDRRKPGGNSKFGTQPVFKIVFGRMAELFRLLGQTRPVRFLGTRWWEGKELPGKRIGEGWARVLSITPLGPQRMIDLQTSTKTFIAEGFVSHNSTLAESLVAHRILTRPYIRALSGADVEEQAGYLFRMVDRLYQQLPWFLKPDRLYFTKNREMTFANQSFLKTAWGKSTRGALQLVTGQEGSKGAIGRGQTYSVIHICVAPNTLIQRADGTLRPIVDIQSDDQVVTHAGRLATVRRCWKSPRTNELTRELWCWGSFAPLSTTRDHLLLSDRGWVAAQELQQGDWILHPVRSIFLGRTEFSIETLSIGGSHASRSFHQKTYPLSRDWGYLLGLYLAEGSLMKDSGRVAPLDVTGIAWSVDRDEVSSVVERIERTFGEAPSGVSDNCDSRTRVIRLHRVGLARWIAQEFGSTDTKHVPAWVWEAGWDFCLGLVEGYIDGDGHWVPDKNEIYATSVRVAIPVQIRNLVASLGFGWSSIHYRAPGVYYERRCRAAWTLQIAGPTSVALRGACGRPCYPTDEAFHWRWAPNGHIFTEISSTGDGFSETFYDLEIDSPDHSFSGVTGTLHNSELPTWENPEQLDTALLPTVPYSLESLVLYEATAEFAGDWWHLHWQAAGEGIGRFVNAFIPWCAEPTKYSLPAPVDWVPSAQTLEIAAKCERDFPRWSGGRSITLTRDQLYWYETTRAYYQRKGELYKFLKEYPCDDQECFQYAGRAIFTLEQLAAIDQAGSRRPLLDVWRVEPAREIAELRRLSPEDGKGDIPSPRRRPDPPLTLRVGPVASGVAHEVFPVPPGYGFSRLSPTELKALPSLRQDVFAIWEYPRPRGTRRYVMAVDVGEGLGADYSIIDVIRLPTIEESAEQVAQYCSNLVDTKALAFVCDAIGRLYCDADQIEALAAIETNGPGLATQDTLQLHLGYSHFYVWEYADAASPARRYSTKIGWVTNARTRPLLISSFYAAVTNFDPIANLPELILNSPITRAELRHFVTEGTIGDAQAARGQHDDAVLAAAIGYYVAWRLAGGETEPISERRARRAAQAALRAHDQTAARKDWRNSAVTAEEMQHGLESDDEFADDHDVGGAHVLHFDPRSRIDLD